MTDGKIGLFDTKARFTAKIAKPKAEALSRYIRDNKNKEGFLEELQFLRTVNGCTMTMRNMSLMRRIFLTGNHLI